MAKITSRLLANILIGLLILSASVALAYSLLCWLTPAVIVANNGTAVISDIVVQLPSNTLRFDRLKPGQRAQIYYDADQKEGQYTIALNLSAKSVTANCGAVARSEWGKRMVIEVSKDGSIECKEQFRY